LFSFSRLDRQLEFMALTALPFDLFRLSNAKFLCLNYNAIRSLPREIALLANLEQIWVRCVRRMVAVELTVALSDRQQPAHVDSR
jgi:hypothetical protein